MKKKLQILKEIEPIINPKTGRESKQVLVKCFCGNEFNAKMTDIRYGGIKNCGCEVVEKYDNGRTTHGESHTPLHFTWAMIKQRCNNPKSQSYDRYGGRGISMCKEWEDNYVVFREWAISNGWRKGLEVDRIDNDGNYSPENCRITNREENMRNTSRALKYEYNGELKPLSEWCDILKINYRILYGRVEINKMTIQEAITHTRKVSKRPPPNQIDLTFAKSVNENLSDTGRKQKWLFAKLDEYGCYVDYFDLSKKLNGYFGFTDDEITAISDILKITNPLNEIYDTTL